MGKTTTLKEVREGCNKIDETLKGKLLSLKYYKSKFVIIGSAKARAEMEKLLTLSRWEGGLLDHLCRIFALK